MTTTTARPRPAKRTEKPGLGRAIGKLVIDAYERAVNDVVHLERTRRPGAAPGRTLTTLLGDARCPVVAGRLSWST